MKANKGFTLIELLAVIVILAVIALIATPMIMNTINDAKQGAAKSSAYAYLHALENQIAMELALEGGTIEDAIGTLASEVDADLVKSSAPDAVNLSINNKGVVDGGYISVDGYYFTVVNGTLSTTETFVSATTSDTAG